MKSRRACRGQLKSFPFTQLVSPILKMLLDVSKNFFSPVSNVHLQILITKSEKYVYMKCLISRNVINFLVFSLCIQMESNFFSFTEHENNFE